jgi:hypothetical protein
VRPVFVKSPRRVEALVSWLQLCFRTALMSRRPSLPRHDDMITAAFPPFFRSAVAAAGR